MANLSKERIFGEMEKALLKSDTPSIFFETLREMNQLHDWFPEMESLIGVEQSPKWHPEGDVWNHTMLVIDQAAKLRGKASNPLFFMIAAVCHDFGKPSTTVHHEDGKITSIGHDDAGVAFAEAFVTRLSNEVKLQTYVTTLVKLHMKPHMFCLKAKQKTMNKLWDKAGIFAEDLILLSKADNLGRGGEISDDADKETWLRESLEAFRVLNAPLEDGSSPEVTGKDLIAAGLKPSKHFSTILEETHKLFLCGVPKNSALKSALAMAKKLGA